MFPLLIRNSSPSVIRIKKFSEIALNQDGQDYSSSCAAAFIGIVQGYMALGLHFEVGPDTCSHLTQTKLNSDTILVTFACDRFDAHAVSELRLIHVLGNLLPLCW